MRDLFKRILRLINWVFYAVNLLIVFFWYACQKITFDICSKSNQITWISFPQINCQRLLVKVPAIPKWPEHEFFPVYTFIHGNTRRPDPPSEDINFYNTVLEHSTYGVNSHYGGVINVYEQFSLTDRKPGRAPVFGTVILWCLARARSRPKYHRVSSLFKRVVLGEKKKKNQKKSLNQKFHSRPSGIFRPFIFF